LERCWLEERVTDIVRAFIGDNDAQDKVHFNRDFLTRSSKRKPLQRLLIGFFPAAFLPLRLAQQHQ
jgi:hypothetical protein